jgi:hypothetical protein
VSKAMAILWLVVVASIVAKLGVPRGFADGH